MAFILDFLSSRIDGFLAASILDSESSLPLITENHGKFDLDIFTAMSAKFLRMQNEIVNLLAAEKVEGIQVSSLEHYHIIHPLKEYPTLFLYIILEKKLANLGMVYITIKEFEEKYNFI
ncbi:hypothetical protein P256_02582 [Acinetobacter nectaris CIP 110549]|uniref:Roadblock/LAMTOR2 domain-containing protein n=1 Tax=Acinetobacter nectaris CIP 110549 TaxID=1392540 RepID=V2TDT9_9GAMM|nr:hypothetical protein [Acinetobacter nectaris]ESK35847.1 hypothetical protein P256_02582 [Acinetobacter nectaris CIP 110549]